MGPSGVCMPIRVRAGLNSQWSVSSKGDDFAQGGWQTRERGEESRMRRANTQVGMQRERHVRLNCKSFKNACHRCTTAVLLDEENFYLCFDVLFQAIGMNL